MKRVVLKTNYVSLLFTGIIMATRSMAITPQSRLIIYIQVKEVLIIID